MAVTAQKKVILTKIKIYDLIQHARNKNRQNFYQTSEIWRQKSELMHLRGRMAENNFENGIRTPLMILKTPGKYAKHEGHAYAKIHFFHNQ